MEYSITLLITESHEVVLTIFQKNSASDSASVAVVKSVEEEYYRRPAFFRDVRFIGKPLL